MRKVTPIQQKPPQYNFTHQRAGGKSVALGRVRKPICIKYGDSKKEASNNIVQKQDRFESSMQSMKKKARDDLGEKDD